MKNIYEVLRQKEVELQQLQKDIEALRVAARLLSEEDESEGSSPRPVSSSVPGPRVAAGAAGGAGRSTETVSQAGIRQFP